MSKTAYFNLSISAPRRLEMMQRDFANHATRYPHCPEHAKPKSWRDVRGWTHGNYQAAFCAGLSAGFNGEGAARVPVWYTHDDAQFRDERYCDDVYSGIDHTGWFSDPHQDEKYRGIVARLPHGRFIAGYMWSANNERVYFAEVFNDEREAARAADEHARVMGECEYAYQEKRQAAIDLNESIDSAMRRLVECLALRNRPCFARLRHEARQLIESIREMRERFATEFADVEI